MQPVGIIAIPDNPLFPSFSILVKLINTQEKIETKNVFIPTKHYFEKNNNNNNKNK